MIRLATVFSGIGSIEWALKKLNVPHKVVFACDNGERYIKDEYEEIKEQIRHLDHYEIKQFIDELYYKTGKKNFVQESYMNNFIRDLQERLNVDYIEKVTHESISC